MSRIISILILLAVSVGAQTYPNIPTTGLVFAGFANIGVTTTPTTYSGGADGLSHVNLGVTEWADQAPSMGGTSSANNFYWLGPSATNAPILTNDTWGNSMIWFPFNGSPGGANDAFTWLQTTSGVIGSATNLTVFIVCSGPRSGCFNYKASGQGPAIVFSGLQSTGGTVNFGFSEYPSVANHQYPSGFQIVGEYTSLYAPMNMAVFTWAGTTSNTEAWYNYNRSTNLAFNAGFCTNFQIGGWSYTITNGSGAPYGGYIKSLLIYTNAMADSTRVSIILALAQLPLSQPLVTNFTRQVVCVGDSITQGYESWGMLSYPQQLINKLPELAVFDVGIGGATINTNGVGWAPGNLYSNANTLTDTLFNTNRFNYLSFKAGINDLSASVYATNVFKRMTNYFAALTNAWVIEPATIVDYYANSGAYAASVYNQSIRTNVNPYYSNWVDSGAGSPYWTNFNASDNNDLYYAGGYEHPNNNGYYYIALARAQRLNWPRRSGAFF